MRAKATSEFSISPSSGFYNHKSFNQVQPIQVQAKTSRRSIRFDDDSFVSDVDFKNSSDKKVYLGSLTSPIVPILKKSGLQTDRSQEGSLLNNSRLSCISGVSDTKSEYCEFRAKTLVIERNYKQLNTRKYYQSKRSELKRDKRKFTDELFPPTINSIVNSIKSPHSSKYLSTRWNRLPDYFKNKTVVLIKQSSRNILRRGSFGSNAFISGLTAVGTNLSLLSQIFQNFQEISQQGIYCVNVCQEGIWRSIVIDDYYPNVHMLPLFVTVAAEQQTVQIWPFLVIKAIAKVYGTFQTISCTSFNDLIFELTGTLCQNQLIKPDFIGSTIFAVLQSKGLAVITCQEKLRARRLGVVGDCLELLFFPVVKMRVTNQQKCQLQLQLNDAFGQVQQSSQHVQVIGPGRLRTSSKFLFKNFSHITLSRYTPEQFYAARPIRQPKESFVIRSISVMTPTKCQFMLIQKDQRHFRNNLYSYSWVRFMLIQKEMDGYRYITGKFGAQKILSLQSELQIGEYYLLAIAEWKGRVYEMTMAYLGNQFNSIERPQTENYQQMLSDVGLDISQRFGELQQINSNLCVYRVSHPETGLVCQNFNNQNEYRPLNLKKSYRRQLKQENLSELTRLVNKEGTLEVKIGAKCSVTVMFMIKQIKPEANEGEILSPN